MWQKLWEIKGRVVHGFLVSGRVVEVSAAQ